MIVVGKNPLRIEVGRAPWLEETATPSLCGSRSVAHTPVFGCDGKNFIKSSLAST